MLIILYLYVGTNIFKNKIFENLFFTVMIISMLFNFANYIVLMQEIHYKNKLESQYCSKIENFIQKNNISIDKATIVCVPGKRDRIYFNEIKSRNAFSINEITGYVGAVSGLNTNSNLDLEEINVNKDIYQEYMKRIDDGDKGIEESYILIIKDILVMPAFIW